MSNKKYVYEIKYEVVIEATDEEEANEIASFIELSKNKTFVENENSGFEFNLIDEL